MAFSFSGVEQNSVAIDTDSGWPPLSTGECREHRRIPEFYDETVIGDALNRSVMEVQQQIIRAVLTRRLPFEFAGDAPAFSVAQTSVYRTAVYSRTHAELVSYFSAVDQKDAGNDTEQVTALQAHSNQSMRLLLGLGRAGVHAL
ncbi:head completion/stabilization protein [Pseudoalteromonas obscura]|uniref:Head completion/stabilization protein n=1 Tax=Pseudoalteromonas obscura TaxID=3048491 RepID=A0ABT7ES70_9GAMM|nr:head completion/stabilization protein [Pseudoalteromonas sp. P94(2023)]MDK2597907.1 head completion/stabilization protein [Pseudoalteromonas sp. P94(2023)]